MEPFHDARPRLPAPPAAIHLVGIGGSGMSGLARILRARGYRVTGSDATDSPTMQALREEGFSAAVGHDPAWVEAVDLVVMTAAAPEANPELVAARARGIPVVKRAALLGLLCDGHTCVAVAGTHGKSTTSSMLALALERAGEDPSFAIGAVVSQLGTNARAGAGPVFVAEADEYDYSFLWLRPAVAIVTSIEHDHPDLFPALADIEAAFDRFVSGIRAGGALVIAADEPGCRRLLARLGRDDIRVIPYGTGADAAWRVERAGDGATVYPPGRAPLRLRLAVPGWHNCLNATAALAAGAALGIDLARLLPGLAAFSGIGRRFELRGQAAGVTVIEDYAHHPTEIAATVAVARERYPRARLWAVFQPHTYSRTRLLLGEFAAALGAADRVVLTAIYAARETDDLGVSSADIARLIDGVPVEVVETPEAAAVALAPSVDAGDVVLVLGAGDVWRAGPALLGRLTQG